MAATTASHAVYVRTLGRFAARLACWLLSVKRQPVYAGVCSCGWVGRPRIAYGIAWIDAERHGREQGW